MEAEQDYQPYDPPPLFDDDGIATGGMPPHSMSVEQSVLGAVLVNNESWDTIADIVREGDFYAPSHRRIFAAIARLIGEQRPADILTAAEDLDKHGELDQVGGVQYIAEMAAATPSVANVRAYAEKVHEYAIRRALIKAASAITDYSFNPDGRDSDALLEESQRELTQILEGQTKEGGPRAITPLLKSVVDRIDELFRSDADITGVSTGYDRLDQLTSGLQKTDLIIVAARPSMGKTSFAMNLVENAVLTGDAPVLVFSMEMSAEQLMLRMMSSVGKIHQTRLRTGKLIDEDWPKLTSAVSRLKDRPLFIDDTPSLSPTEMRARARRVQREQGDLSMIMIDYLQLMQVSGKGGDNRTAEISEISRSLKSMAKEFNCPVVALSQLNRALENRPNKRPINADLRESGAIEQDADVIMFIYRDEVYNEESPDAGTAEIIIGKQRNGPIDTARLSFIGEYTRFENLSTVYQEYT